MKGTTVGEVVPFNKKQVLNKIEETLGRGDLQFELVFKMEKKLSS